MGATDEMPMAVRYECPQWRYEGAAYVLGALTREDRHRYERHLRGCPACRRELVGLAGLPGLLRRLTEAEALGGDDTALGGNDTALRDDDTALGDDGTA
jgi:predicted anti-sigma-YlaC factor YlaD